MMVNRRTVLAYLLTSPGYLPTSRNGVMRQPVLGLVATRQRTIPDNVTTVDSTNNSLNSRMTCVAPTGNSITGIRLALPGFGYVPPESNLTGSYTATAAVEYPVGVFTPVTNGGVRPLVVPPAQQAAAFDLLPIAIPAGATFWIKTFVQWTGSFRLCGQCACNITADWTNRGVGLADNTLTATTFATTSGTVGFGPIVYATFSGAQRCLGILGDSIGYASADAPNPLNNDHFFERALVDAVPALNVSFNGNTLQEFDASGTGRRYILNGSIDRLICELGVNDTFSPITLAALQSRAQLAWSTFLSAGVKVWQTTLTPRTTSTDGWATRANQTIVNATAEALRIGFNAWIRANYASLGLTGYLDFAHAVDPTDSGVWNADGTAGTSGAGFCTVSAGAVSACDLAVYNSGGNSHGDSYPTGTVPCTVRPYAGDAGVLPTITATANGSGNISGFTVNSAGSGLTYPPMVAVNGAWTVDGTHPNARGYNEMIYLTGLGPALFA